MYIKRIMIVLVIFSFIISVITGCGTIDSQREDEDIIQYEGSKRYLKLEEAIDLSYCVVSAKLNGVSEDKTHREYDFILKKTIIGSMDSGHFFVTESYTDYSVENTGITYSTNKTEYEVGKEYILVLSKESLVYYEKDQYMILGDIFIELDDVGNIVEYRRYHQKEESPYNVVDEFSEYALSVTDKSKERVVHGVPFTRSSEIPDIVDASQYIVKAIVKNIHIKAPHINRDTYLCTVTETLRGSTDDEILIVLFKDTVSIGEEYLFLLNKENESSLIYTLSSVNSVVDLEKEKSIVEEIIRLISK